jgi:tetratricopeptide (TPR) repeat protein
MKKAFLLLICMMLLGAAWAQTYSSGSKKAVKRFEEAVSLYQMLDLQGAEEALLLALRSDDNFIEAYQLLAQICFETDRLNEAIEYFSRTLEIDPEGNPEAYRMLAGLLVRTGAYEKALGLLETYLSFSPELLNYREMGEVLRETCLFAIESMKNPVPFEPENLGSTVNSDLNEYWPSLSVDEQLLMFTVMLPKETGRSSEQDRVHEDFFFAVKEKDGWGNRENAGAPLNTLDNEGTQSMTADGKVLYFTACNRRDGKGQCDIYMAIWEEGNWNTPVNIGAPVNTRYSEKHPTISADGRALFFTSNRPGGKGSYDIWTSERSGEGWTIPVNLGDSVNTAGLEQSPFLHPDQASLYFSSTGWPGMGQGDLFLTRKEKDQSWSFPVNLGFPINTYNDEIGLSVNARGDRAYFASDREKGTDTDIFTFELPEEFRPVVVSYLTGRVYDSRNMKGLVALIQLIDLETEEVVMETPSTQGEGDYLVSLPTDRDYALNVSAEGYLFHSGHFSFNGEHSRIKPYRRDIPLDRIIVGNSMVLNNIFFEVDSFSILPASRTELNLVVSFMKNNPSVFVEIGGHTDSTGSATHNQELSEKRAGAVMFYLYDQGIPEERLKSTGYGDTMPVGKNQTDEGRARNRRTELKIIKVE